jgi:hypothetical protein
MAVQIGVSLRFQVPYRSFSMTGVTDRDQIRARSIDSDSSQLMYDEAVVLPLVNHPEQALKALREGFKRLLARGSQQRPGAERVQDIPDLGSDHGVRR